jgi:hypothetical protein
MKAPLEIERKYLIHMPNVAALEDMQGVRVFHITQTYLCAPAGITRRVRRRTEGDKTVYILTEKERVSSLTAVERERELTEAERAEQKRLRDAYLAWFRSSLRGGADGKSGSQEGEK